MNISINYDFMNTIGVTNKPSVFKLVKHAYSTNSFARVALTAIAAHSILFYSPIRALARITLSAIGIPYLINLFGSQPIKNSAVKLVKELPNSFNSLNIKTNDNLLGKSKLEKTEYKIRINENKMPQLIQSKYILVPSYGPKGEVRNTSVVQEHQLFSKKYVLSKLS